MILWYHYHDNHCVLFLDRILLHTEIGWNKRWKLRKMHNTVNDWWWWSTSYSNVKCLHEHIRCTHESTAQCMMQQVDGRHGMYEHAVIHSVSNTSNVKHSNLRDWDLAMPPGRCCTFRSRGYPPCIPWWSRRRNSRCSSWASLSYS